MIVDFPTFGNPISPTSAISFSSSSTNLPSPGYPGFEKFGICLVAVAKRRFPQPPVPPFATIYSSSREISAITSPVSKSFITVPRGTLITRSSPDFPRLLEPLPASPSAAIYFLLYLKSIRVERLPSPRKTILPPFPPSPPSGPPAATYFSLRKDTAPFPPSPAFIYIFATSTNCTI